MSTRDSETSAWTRRGRRGETERLAHAESARIDADTARREAELDRLDAEAARKRADAMRVVAQTTALQLATERDQALAKASELEAELAAARDRLAGQREVEGEKPDEPVTTQPAPAPAAEKARPAAPPAPTGPESIRFAPRGHRPVLTILLALASLGAAAAAVYEAYRDQLTSGPGVLAATATVVLAVTVGRLGRGATVVSIEKGVVHVTSGGDSDRADLTSTSTLVELIDRPGGRKVILVRKTQGPLTVDDSMVDLDAFIEAVRHWRSNL